MTPAQFAKFIRLQSGTDTTTLPDANLLLYANIVKNEIAKEVYKIDEDFFGMEVKKDLVAGQRWYAKPDEMLGSFKKVEAVIDGVKRVPLHEYDMSIQFRDETFDEAGIVKAMSGKNPAFDIFGDQLVLLSSSPILDVTDGLIMYCPIFPADLTNLSSTDEMSLPPSSTTYGMPIELHKVWATGVIIEYKNSRPKPLALTDREQNYKTDLDIAINSLKGQNKDRDLQSTVPYNDGSKY